MRWLVQLGCTAALLLLIGNAVIGFERERERGETDMNLVEHLQYNKDTRKNNAMEKIFILSRFFD
jgi:hypothetical protein